MVGAAELRFDTFLLTNDYNDDEDDTLPRKWRVDRSDVDALASRSTVVKLVADVSG